MKRGIIKLQISDVWELLNKPYRVISIIETSVNKLPVGNYEYLNFDSKTKKELLKKLRQVKQTGILL